MATAAAAAPDLDRAVALFHALSDPIRLRALDLLRGGEMCVCDLQAELDLAQSRLSFHLRVLKDAGLVEDRREGRWSYYTIVPDALGEAHDLVVEFLPRTAKRACVLPVQRAAANGGAARRCCN